MVKYLKNTRNNIITIKDVQSGKLGDIIFSAVAPFPLASIQNVYLLKNKKK